MLVEAEGDTKGYVAYAIYKQREYDILDDVALSKDEKNEKLGVLYDIYGKKNKLVFEEEADEALAKFSVNYFEQFLNRKEETWESWLGRRAWEVFLAIFGPAFWAVVLILVTASSKSDKMWHQIWEVLVQNLSDDQSEDKIPPHPSTGTPAQH